MNRPQKHRSHGDHGLTFTGREKWARATQTNRHNANMRLKISVNQSSAKGVLPQGIRCAATRCQVCRHKMSGVSPQDTRCAATRYQMYRHKISDVPPKGVKCAATKLSGVPLQDIRCDATRCEDCQKASGVCVYNRTFEYGCINKS
jgi:hypothetical protein